MIERVFIANRGEIAVRIIRTLRVMGIRSVLGASECDLSSVAAKLADEVVCLGGDQASESYLNIEKVVAAILASDCQAVHPGYGFLSERDEFVSACESANIVFLGPSSQSMKLLGNKVEAKLLAESLNVPLVPGYFKPGASQGELRDAANEIGYPILLKAAAGGGGRGMRQVLDPSDFDFEFQSARDEAIRAFGDGEIMVEKLVARPRHIEIQIAADQHGHVVALFERECSLQRRRQKVVEEAGAVLANFGNEIWPAMRQCAIDLVKAAHYTGVATTEFLVDEDSGKFYFLEVNARLQVEHPVSELVTGVDLVRVQIDIANGLNLNFNEAISTGNRAGLFGHAIEMRIIAEDPAQNFMPSVGRLEAFAPPTGPGIRVDAGFQAGDEITRFYDSLIAKLIVFGTNRREAIERAKAALRDFHILGVKTNIPYLIEIFSHPDFISGDFDVNWLEKTFLNWQPTSELNMALGCLIRNVGTRAVTSLIDNPDNMVDFPNWQSLAGFRN